MLLFRAGRGGLSHDAADINIGRPMHLVSGMPEIKATGCRIAAFPEPFGDGVCLVQFLNRDFDVIAT
jgi:hypothetical protein